MYQMNRECCECNPEIHIDTTYVEIKVPVMSDPDTIYIKAPTQIASNKSTNKVEEINNYLENFTHNDSIATLMEFHCGHLYEKLRVQASEIDSLLTKRVYSDTIATDSLDLNYQAWTTGLLDSLNFTYKIKDLTVLTPQITITKTPKRKKPLELYGELSYLTNTNDIYIGGRLVSNRMSFGYSYGVGLKELSIGQKSQFSIGFRLFGRK